MGTRQIANGTNKWQAGTDFTPPLRYTLKRSARRALFNAA
jgi:hypothetical protein